MPLHHACHSSLLPPPTLRPSPAREGTRVAPVPYRPCARFTIQHVFAERVNEQRGISRKDKEERCFHLRNHPTNEMCRACRNQAVSSAWAWMVFSRLSSCSRNKEAGRQHNTPSLGPYQVWPFSKTNLETWVNPICKAVPFLMSLFLFHYLLISSHQFVPLYSAGSPNTQTGLHQKPECLGEASRRDTGSCSS